MNQKNEIEVVTRNNSNKKVVSTFDIKLVDTKTGTLAKQKLKLPIKSYPNSIESHKYTMSNIKRSGVMHLTGDTGSSRLSIPNKSGKILVVNSVNDYRRV